MHKFYCVCFIDVIRGPIHKTLWPVYWNFLGILNDCNQPIGPTAKQAFGIKYIGIRTTLTLFCIAKLFFRSLPMTIKHLNLISRLICMKSKLSNLRFYRKNVYAWSHLKLFCISFTLSFPLSLLINWFNNLTIKNLNLISFTLMPLPQVAEQSDQGLQELTEHSPLNTARWDGKFYYFSILLSIYSSSSEVDVILNASRLYSSSDRHTLKMPDSLNRRLTVFISGKFLYLVWTPLRLKMSLANGEISSLLSS